MIRLTIVFLPVLFVSSCISLYVLSIYVLKGFKLKPSDNTESLIKFSRIRQPKPVDKLLSDNICFKREGKIVAVIVSDNFLM